MNIVFVIMQKMSINLDNIKFADYYEHDDCKDPLCLAYDFGNRYNAYNKARVDSINKEYRSCDDHDRIIELRKLPGKNKAGREIYLYNDPMEYGNIQKYETDSEYYKMRNLFVVSNIFAFIVAMCISMYLFKNCIIAYSFYVTIMIGAEIVYAILYCDDGDDT